MAEIVNGVSEAILENIRQANLRRLQDRVRDAKRSKTAANPADSRMVATFLDLCHNGRRSK